MARPPAHSIQFVMADGSTRVKYNYNVCAEYYLNVLD